MFLIQTRIYHCPKYSGKLQSANRGGCVKPGLSAVTTVWFRSGWFSHEHNTLECQCIYISNYGILFIQEMWCHPLGSSMLFQNLVQFCRSINPKPKLRHPLKPCTKKHNYSLLYFHYAAEIFGTWIQIYAILNIKVWILLLYFMCVSQPQADWTKQEEGWKSLERPGYDSIEEIQSAVVHGYHIVSRYWDTTVS